MTGPQDVNLSRRLHEEQISMKRGLYGTIHFAQIVCLLIASASHAVADGKEHAIGADDVIEITVLNHPDLNKILTVLSDGTVTYPWVGKMQVSGRTPSQVSDQIRTELEKTKNNVV